MKTSLGSVANPKGRNFGRIATVIMMCDQKMSGKFVLPTSWS
jgi:hypothetical protein